MSLSVYNNIQKWETARDKLPHELSLGLVPTMGNLHRGHLALIEAALRDNDACLATIFVNPKQFGPDEDYSRYPRTLEQDLEKIQQRFADREVHILAPHGAQEFYPQGYATTIKVQGITEILCGQSRPGHFEGVTTIVYQLLQTAQAQNAYFGQKDYQQFKVIERMVMDLKIPTAIHMQPIVRDEDGLALSSRNQYLSEEERQRALKLCWAIEQACEKPDQLKQIKEQTAQDLNWDYLEIRDARDLSVVSDQTHEAVVLGAAHVGQTRLIDNKIFNLQKVSS